MQFIVFSALIAFLIISSETKPSGNDGKKSLSVRVIRSDFGAEPLLKHSNVLYNFYYGEVVVGTPGQKMRLAIDASAADSWLLSSKCTDECFSCQGHNRFDSSKSSTFNKNDRNVSFPFTIGSDTISGFISTDNLEIGSLQVRNQSFTEAILDQPYDVFQGAPYDGVLGLGFKSSSETGVTTVLDNMVDQGVIASRVYSLWLNSNNSSKNGGELTIGGVNSDHYSGSITYAPLLNKSSWSFTLDNVSLGESVSLCKNGCPAIVLSSLPYIVLPMEAVEAFIEIFGAVPSYGTFFFDCSRLETLPSITFNINGTPFTMTPNDYAVQGDESDPLCVLKFAIPSEESQEEWMLGQGFLEKFFTVFDADNSRLGFAKAR